jgi:hypothetical protein
MCASSVITIDWDVRHHLFKTSIYAWTLSSVKQSRFTGDYYMMTSATLAQEVMSGLPWARAYRLHSRYGVKIGQMLLQMWMWLGRFVERTYKQNNLAF